MLQKSAWSLLTVLSLGVAAYALTILILPTIRPEFLRERFVDVPVATYAHIAASAVALIVGPFQLNSRLRANHLNVHRWLGRVYILAVLFGGVASVILAPLSQGGLPAHVGFGLLGSLWLITTLLAYRMIRSGNVIAHRRWIIRSYALAFAAVTLRIYVPLTTAAGLPFETAYPAISWFCWVPNLIVAEWLFLPKDQLA